MQENGSQLTIHPPKMDWSVPAGPQDGALQFSWDQVIQDTWERVYNNQFWRDNLLFDELKLIAHYAHHDITPIQYTLTAKGGPSFLVGSTSWGSKSLPVTFPGIRTIHYTGIGTPLETLFLHHMIITWYMFVCRSISYDLKPSEDIPEAVHKQLRR